MHEIGKGSTIESNSPAYEIYMGSGVHRALQPIADCDPHMGNGDSPAKPQGSPPAAIRR